MAATETGIPANPQTTAPQADDPFSAQREAGNDPFKETEGTDLSGVAGPDTMRADSTGAGSPTEGRRMSKEWDASKVPPSQFQKRKGSIFATQGGRDGHVGGKDRDKAYFDKLKEKGWFPGSSTKK